LVAGVEIECVWIAADGTLSRAVIPAVCLEVVIQVILAAYVCVAAIETDDTIS
jgi:hypothetical protein